MGSTSFDQPSIDSSTTTEPMVPSNHGPHDHGSTHCPRCDSTHTKFCYYNNYSLSQPRYFCKSCRRYWTKGGTLRNIPVGGVCRKNKKISSNFKKPTTHNRRPRQPHPDPQFMFENLTTGGGGGGGWEDDRISGGFPGLVDSGGYGAGMDDNIDTHGLSLETTAFEEYDREYYERMMSGIDVKPRVLTLGLGSWEDGQAGLGCSSDPYGSGEVRNGSPGYLLGFGSSWAGLMKGYGSSTI